MRPQPADILKQFIKAYNSFDIEGMLSLLHPDIHFVNISGDKVNTETYGKSEFEKLARNSANLFRERGQKIVKFKNTADLYEVDIQYHAVLAADIPNGMKKGEIIDLKGKSVYQIRNNLIISIRDIS